MVSGSGEGSTDLDAVRTVAELGAVLRRLRRRQARRSGTAELSCRELAARTGWAHGALGEYLGGRTLPPTDRFDVLVLLLGATPDELGPLATARDRVAELRRSARTVAVPRELPPQAFGFSGRDAECAELDGLLGGAATSAATVVAAIVGMAGVGKTALAVSWAHRVRDRFPDGQLYVDLRGYDPQRPAPPERALAALLRSLGVGGGDLPAELDEAARRYRSLLAGRRLLVVLDNAATAEQVRPLLPGSATCFVLVTSRDDLAGLVARDGARRVPLEPLSPGDAVQLLGALVGPRVAVEPQAAGALAQRCARLPLALRIAAELVAARADATLGGLVDELATRGLDVLDVLDAGDDARSAIRSVFSWSLRHLPPAAAECFGLLGLHPGESLEPGAVAALAATGAAQPLLDRLERAHLVHRDGTGRYRMHDLLRAYAAELGARHPLAGQRCARLLEHYLDRATAAMDALFPVERDCPNRPAGFDQPGALAWLDAERANLVAVCAHAARHSPDRCGALASTIWRYLDAHAHYRDSLAVHSDAAAVAAPGSAALGEALTNLGMAHWRLGECERAIELLERALVLRRETGERLGEAQALAGLGIVYEQLGRYADSLAHHRGAIAAYRALGEGRRLAGALGNLGVLYWRLGRHPEAIECHERAASAGRELGDERIEGYALANLGLVYQQVGRYQEALRSHRLALQGSRRFGDRRAEADTLGSIGVTCARMRLLPQALEHFEQALAIATELGHRALEAETLNDQGAALAALGRFDAALRHHTSAQVVACEIGDRYEQARAFDGMATALAGDGRAADAQRRRRQARSLYADLGLGETAAAGTVSELPRHG